MSGGTRFYSNCQRYLEGIARGIEFTADGGLEVGEITPSDDPSFPFVLEVTEESAEEWLEDHSYFNPGE